MIVYPIVEGHGEVAAVPVLLRRMAQERFEVYDLAIARPHRLSRGRIINGDDLERAAELARRRIRQEGQGAIVVLMDADDDCAAELAPRLQQRLRVVVGDTPAFVVLPTREYEAWFLAAARSLRRSPRVVPQAEPPEDPEAVRGAKEYLLRSFLAPGENYSETVDQESFTAIMNFDEARMCRSFRKLCDDLAAILQVGKR